MTENTAKKKDTSAPEASRTLSPMIAFFAVLFIFFAAQIVAINIMAIFGSLIGETGAELTDWLGSSLIIQSATFVLIVGVGLLLVKLLLKLTNTSWKKIGLDRLRLGYVGQALIGYGWYFLLFLGMTFFVGNFVPQVDLEQQQQLGFDRMATGAALGFIGLCLVVLPAFYEEVLMRGVLFSGLRSKLSFPLTLIIVSLVFGAAHLEYGGSNPLNVAAAIDTFALSVVLVYLREKSKSLWPAIFLHGLKNLVAFSIVFVFKLGGI